MVTICAYIYIYTHFLSFSLSLSLYIYIYIYTHAYTHDLTMATCTHPASKAGRLPFPLPLYYIMLWHRGSCVMFSTEWWFSRDRNNNCPGVHPRLLHPPLCQPNVLCYAILCYVMLLYLMLCNVMLGCVLFCSVMHVCRYCYYYY